MVEKELLAMNVELAAIPDENSLVVALTGVGGRNVDGSCTVFWRLQPVSLLGSLPGGVQRSLWAGSGWYTEGTARASQTHLDEVFKRKAWEFAVAWSKSRTFREKMRQSQSLPTEPETNESPPQSF